jgi:hypothetical protein
MPYIVMRPSDKTYFCKNFKLNYGRAKQGDVIEDRKWNRLRMNARVFKSEDSAKYVTFKIRVNKDYTKDPPLKSPPDFWVEHVKHKYFFDNPQGLVIIKTRRKRKQK